MTARAARLEQGVQVTRGRFKFFGPPGMLGSQHNVVSAVATLPRMKGQKGFVHSEAW